MLKIVKFNISIDPKNIDITLSGSAVAKIANILIPLIKSSLIPVMVDSIEKEIKTLIETTID